MIQAAGGDVQGAKNTVAQINDPAMCPGPGGGHERMVLQRRGDVRPSARPPAGYVSPGSRYYLTRDRSPDHVPAQVPQGLPANYLAADPRHGAVVDFIDETDSYGTRVTARRYADGYVVIETPHAAKNGQ